MAKYLISFPSGAMDHIAAEDLPQVARESRAVILAAKETGTYVFGGGIAEEIPPVVVDADGSARTGTYPQTGNLGGGFTVLEVATREEAISWAARIATACRCDQELREFMYDPIS